MASRRTLVATLASGGQQEKNKVEEKELKHHAGEGQEVLSSGHFLFSSLPCASQLPLPVLPQKQALLPSSLPSVGRIAAGRAETSLFLDRHAVALSLRLGFRHPHL